MSTRPELDDTRKNRDGGGKKKEDVRRQSEMSMRDIGMQIADRSSVVDTVNGIGIEPRDR